MLRLLLPPALLLALPLFLVAQTAADCAADPTPLNVLSVLPQVEADQNYTVGQPETYCVTTDVSTLTGFAFTGQLGTVVLTSNVSPYPYVVELTDLSTMVTTTLTDFNDDVAVFGNRRYFIRILPLSVGSADLLLRPTASVSAFGVPSQMATVTVDADLPVVWGADLAVRTQGKQRVFSWSVTAERNVADYRLEISEGRAFETVSTLTPRGARGEETVYELTDDLRPRGAYYRVRQTDVDGSVDFTNTVFVAGEETDFLLTPNPADAIVSLVGTDAASRVRLLTGSGRVLPVTYATAGCQTIDLAAVPPGLYFVEVTDPGGKRSTQRLVVR